MLEPDKVAIAEVGAVLRQYARRLEHDQRVDGGHRRRPEREFRAEADSSWGRTDTACAFRRARQQLEAGATAYVAQHLQRRVPRAARDGAVRAHDAFDGDRGA